MTPVQASIFDAPITHGTARKADRYSSTESARRTRPAKAKADVLAALRSAGGVGSLDTVCAALPSMLRNCASRRLTDLEADGVIRATGEHVEGAYGRPLAVWEVVDR